MPQITISDITIDVVRKNIKNLHLAVYPPTGRVRIAAPLRVDDDAVRLFAVSKLAWIKKHQRAFANQPRQTEREYVSGESHYFEGNRYLLNVVFSKSAPTVEIKDKRINLIVKPDSTVEQRERVLTKWYRAHLKNRVPALIEKWEKTINVRVDRWEIKQMKTRWGTCRVEAKRIWLNLELAKKPVHCLEYVVVHELIHLLEPKHNERFVRLLDEFLPTWRASRDELNQFVLSYDEWNC